MNHQCMCKIAEVVSNYKLHKFGSVSAVHQIKCILNSVASSDSEEAYISGNRIILPAHQIVPRDDFFFAVAELLGVLPTESSPSASASLPERTVVEDAGHGCGLFVKPNCQG